MTVRAPHRSFWTLSGSPTLLADPALRAIAEAKHCTPAQALFRLAQLHGVTPLSGTTDAQHMREDVAAEEIDFSDELDGAGEGPAGEAVREIVRLIWA